MADDKKKYNYMEKVLQDINEKFISLSAEETKRNNQILIMLLNTLTEEMKKQDALFKALFSRVFYGGSYYDGLKISNPEEYDLDLLLNFSKIKVDSKLTPSEVPGFVTVKLGNFDVSDDKGRKLQTLINSERLLVPDKVLSWMQSVLTQTLNKYKKLASGEHFLQTQDGEFRLKVHKGGPALTLKMCAIYRGEQLSINIDLVTCFEYQQDKWPMGFKKNPVKNKGNFFIVPKTPKGVVVVKAPYYWRLSFQEQERELIKSKLHLKPTIKLLKQLRDVQNHKTIASYYIKTVILFMNDEKDALFWRNSLSFVLMIALKRYQEFVSKGEIPFYWNAKNNLLGHFNAAAVRDIGNRLKRIIEDIDRNLGNSETILKYLLNPEDLESYRRSSSSLLDDDQSNNNSNCIIF